MEPISMPEGAYFGSVKPNLAPHQPVVGKRSEISRNRRSIETSLSPRTTTMSNAQILHLQYLNAKKLSQDEDSLRKNIAHKNLQSRLEPIAKAVDEELLIEEMSRWFEVILSTNKEENAPGNALAKSSPI
jgi:hypothetical protein